jgi:hypothetical protein
MSDTYQITNPDEVFGYGPCLGTITDALTGATIACFRGGERFPLNTPLCSGCDAPVTSEPCPNCDLPAETLLAA